MSLSAMLKYGGAIQILIPVSFLPLELTKKFKVTNGYMITQTISLYKNAYGGLSRSTWWLALVMLINRSGTMVVPFMTIYMTQHIGVSISKAAFVMSLFGAGAIIGALTGGRLTDRMGSYYIQVTTLIGGGIMFIVL